MLGCGGQAQASWASEQKKKGILGEVQQVEGIVLICCVTLGKSLTSLNLSFSSQMGITGLGE